MDQFALDIPPHVAAVIRHLPPDIKRPVKPALRAISVNPSVGSPLAATTLILKRQKKRFDLIAAPEAGWGRWMRRLQWLHRADVVDQADETGMQDRWQRRAHPGRPVPTAPGPR